jgi:(2R)-ethylmalonyl-CoA mutase
MTREVLALLKAAGLSRIPVVVGGIIPPGDAELLRAEGVAAIYTPKDFAINRIIDDIVAQVERSVSASDWRCG